MDDESIILAAQAADIRKDNGKILGAFVLAGEPLAWGLSKKGYCAIINDSITVGVSENSPLFEESTETGGYFFRQYPLVDNGKVVSSKLENSTIRKALCSRAGEIFVVVTKTNETFPNFAAALVEFGVENAIYLVGSRLSPGWYIDAKGQRNLLFDNSEEIQQHPNHTYIIWLREE
jgi:hypothetical protein